MNKIRGRNSKNEPMKNGCRRDVLSPYTQAKEKTRPEEWTYQKLRRWGRALGNFKHGPAPKLRRILPVDVCAFWYRFCRAVFSSLLARNTGEKQAKKVLFDTTVVTVHSVQSAVGKKGPGEQVCEHVKQKGPGGQVREAATGTACGPEPTDGWRTFRR